MVMSVYAQNSPLWMRYPSISPDGKTIAFSYKGDLFTVPTQGGTATILTTSQAYDFMPVWSPNSKTIAFASDRFGNFDVFTIPAQGGMAQRLSFHSSGEYPTSFSPKGTEILFTSSIEDSPLNSQFPSGTLSELYSIDANGGNITRILTTPAEVAKYSKDGKKIIYHNRKGYENAWRKHHTSSVTRDVMLFDVTSGKHTYLTTFEGEDRSPVFSNSEKEIYYLSEQFGSFNICQIPVDNPSAVKQITKFEKHPVRFLSISNANTLCFSFDGEIYTQPFGESPKKVNINITNDNRYIDVEYMKLSSGASEMAVSPKGDEIALIIRGEVFVTSVEYRTTKRITNTPEQERSVSFSPDGRSLLYASERNNSWNLYQTKLTRDEEKLFANSTVLKEEVLLAEASESFQPTYSPDGKEVAFLNERTELKVINLKTKALRSIMSGKHNYSYSDGDQWYSWSPDSKWFLVNFTPSFIFRSDVGLISATGKEELIDLTKSGYNNNQPKWMMDGEMIIWFSDKQGMRSHGSWGAQNDVYGMFLTQEAYNKFTLSKEEAALLKDDDKNDKKDDAEKKETTDKKKKGKKNSDSDAKEEKKNKVKPIKIEFAGLEDRVKRLTIHSSRLSDAVVSKDGKKLYYLASFEKTSDLWLHDFEENTTKLVKKLSGRGGSLAMNKKGTKLFITSGGKLMTYDTKSKKIKNISYSAEMNLNKAGERAYIFDHAWRQVQKKFYDPNIHGIDWEFYKKEYAKFLPYINNNYDFAEMLSEMLGELNGSHTGASYRVSRKNGDATARLGVLYDWNFTGKGVKIAEILDKSPLLRTKKAIKAGAIITKVNGEIVNGNQDLFRLLNHARGKRILISFTDKTGKSFDEIVKPISSGAQNQLLYERWVKQRREMVEKLSGGRLGYVHVRGMNSSSFREVYSEVFGRNAHKEAIVIDTRFNGGGWLHDDLAVLFSGKSYVTYSPRGQNFGGDPMSRWTKPSILLVSESNYSDAHAFPYVYKTLDIGKIVGMPVPGTMTAVWWETQIDRSIVFGIPQVGAKDINGNYLENQQLEPDFKVNNTFETVSNARDLQVEKAVTEMLKMLDK